MRLMALPPPPPTPITLITAPCTDAVSNENAIFIPHLLLVKHTSENTTNTFAKF